jgi:hypothetical protein
MNDAFLSAGDLFRDRKFVVGFVIAAALAVGGIIFTIDNIVHHKIAINPIARIEFISAESDNAEPISEFISEVGKGQVPSTKEIWFTYVVDLATLCATTSKSEGTGIVVIFKTDKGFTAGTAVLDARTCGFAGRIKSNEVIYATSGTPFPTLPSEKVFFSFEDLVPGSQ